MTATSDKRYGRGGGRYFAPAPTVLEATVKPWPTEARLRRHLEIDHAMSASVLAVHPDVLRSWHLAEHRTRDPAAGKPRHPGHLDHTHPH